MSTFVLLLMTSCVPGLYPVPVADAAPSYNEGGFSGRNSGSRPKFFGRIRGFFSRRSRGGSQSPPANKEAAATGAVNSTPTPVPVSDGVLPGAVSSPIIRSAPVISSPAVAPLQRMPVGAPLQETPAAKPF
jgi:hypothetical protein